MVRTHRADHQIARLEFLDRAAAVGMPDRHDLLDLVVRAQPLQFLGLITYDFGVFELLHQRKRVGEQDLAAILRTVTEDEVASDCTACLFPRQLARW